MRTPFLAIALGCFLTAGVAAAKEAATVQCKDGTTGKAGRGACSHHGGVSSEGAAGGAAEEAEAPAKAVTCKDGTTSRPGRGACSHHGGLAPAGAAAAEPKATRGTLGTPQAKARSSMAAPSEGTDASGATAQCKDGTYSHAKHRSGACSHHGGVAKWLDQP
jgi:hypothetical protein